MAPAGRTAKRRAACRERAADCRQGRAGFTTGPGLLLLTLYLGACAGQAVERTTATRAADADFRPSERVPYAPPAHAHARAGGSVALALSSGAGQARSTALSFVRALLDGDRGSVYALLAERVVHAVEGRQVARAEEVERCLAGADLLTYEPDLVVEDLVDVHGMEVERVDAYHSDMPIPVGIEPSDLVVTLPTRPGAGNSQRLPCLARIYVRAGPRPTVVGLTR